MRDTHRKLANLLGYFHEEWPDLYDSEEDVVKAFIEFWHDDVSAAISEIENILKHRVEEQEILRFIAESGCALDPTIAHGSGTEWLAILRDLLRANRSYPN